MRFITKHVVLGFVLWFALTLPGSAESADGTYRIITFQSDVKKEIENDDSWKVCGDYFSSAESTVGKIVHFTFERVLSGKLSAVFAFGPIDRVIVSIDKKVSSPVVTIHGVWVILKMNAKDYKAGLPCLANGIG